MNELSLGLLELSLERDEAKFTLVPAANSITVGVDCLGELSYVEGDFQSEGGEVVAVLDRVSAVTADALETSMVDLAKQYARESVERVMVVRDSDGAEW